MTIKDKKDQIWGKHFQTIIDIASGYTLEDWDMIVGKSLSQPTMDSTGKHKGLTLLSVLTVEEMVSVLLESQIDD